MQEESTRIINDAPVPEKSQVSNTESKKENVVNSKKGAEVNGNIVYGGAGFVAGMAAGGSAVTAAAHSRTDGNVINEEDIVDETESSNEAQPVDYEAIPSESEAIIATDEGVRVAQVDDQQSFSEAFADARAQVGPGGVFEWHGKVYGTYYESEWNAMSPAEKAEYQSKIDYDDVRGNDYSSENASDAPHQAYHGSNTSSSSADSETITSVEEQEPSYEPVSNSDGYSIITDENGDSIQVMEVEIDGHDAILVDIDLDDNPDSLLVDTNDDGQIDLQLNDYDGDGNPDEALVDIDGDGSVDICVEDLNGDGMITEDEIAYVNDNPYMEANNPYSDTDNMPDYMNDADPGIYV